MASKFDPEEIRRRSGIAEMREGQRLLKEWRDLTADVTARRELSDERVEELRSAMVALSDRMVSLADRPIGTVTRERWLQQARFFRRMADLVEETPRRDPEKARRLYEHAIEAWKPDSGEEPEDEA